MKKRIRRTYRVARYVVYRQTIVEPIDHFWTFVGAFIGIALIGALHKARFGATDNIFLIGSFGASAVLVFGSTNSPLVQPRNLIGGHLIAALIGVTIQTFIPGNEIWLTAGLAVSLSIVAMQMTKTMHPPGGATALIAVIGSEKIKSLGYLYVLSPVFSGVLILYIVAILVNNIPPNRNYPYKK